MSRFFQNDNRRLRARTPDGRTKKAKLAAWKREVMAEEDLAESLKLARVERAIALLPRHDDDVPLGVWK
jgi:hypothetical protein